MCPGNRDTFMCEPSLVRDTFTCVGSGYLTNQENLLVSHRNQVLMEKHKHMYIYTLNTHTHTHTLQCCHELSHSLTQPLDYKELSYTPHAATIQCSVWNTSHWIRNIYRGILYSLRVGCVFMLADGVVGHKQAKWVTTTGLETLVGKRSTA